jgi:DNA-binding transcriptional MerR regulator
MISCVLYRYGRYKIGKAAGILGEEVQTLRAWEKSGELIPGLIDHWRRQAECLRAEQLLERCADELEAILVTVSLPGAEAALEVAPKGKPFKVVEAEVKKRVIETLARLRTESTPCW